MKRSGPIQRKTPLKRSRTPIARTALKRGSKKTGVNDKVLWKWFSLFIRLRDSDENGVCKCFTCNTYAYFREMDCGHGIPRQHLATKYSEKNNERQCTACNWSEGGMREVYKVEMDKKHGAGTWDQMELASRQPNRISQFEVDIMAKYYKEQALKLAKERGIELN